MPQAKLNQLHLHYELAPTPNRSPSTVVFLHGISSAADWAFDARLCPTLSVLTPVASAWSVPDPRLFTVPADDVAVLAFSEPRMVGLSGGTP
jgi:hypothetical protein